MNGEQAARQLNDVNGNDCEWDDDEFTQAEIDELSARIHQLYGDSIEDMAYQLDEYRNADKHRNA